MLGLGFAGSPYAYHSVGSTLAVRAEAYAIVRGVPKRAAGEDFYLLDKLAKVTPIRVLTGEPVAISLGVRARFHLVPVRASNGSSARTRRWLPAPRRFSC